MCFYIKPEEEEKNWMIACNGDAFYRVILVLVQAPLEYLASIFPYWNTVNAIWFCSIFMVKYLKPEEILTERLHRIS